jgi:hypothetical protein
MEGGEWAVVVVVQAEEVRRQVQVVEWRIVMGCVRDETLSRSILAFSPSTIHETACTQLLRLHYLSPCVLAGSIDISQHDHAHAMLRHSHACMLVNT